jgi:16S rRNA (guanine966-N2)-methyltransferase
VKNTRGPVSARLSPASKLPRNRVRIIGGHWRSRQIEFPDAPDLRPTADRVRETLFNWLGQSLHGKRCLDLFAGSGALGFEALSRGADHVVMVESKRTVHAALGLNAKRLDARNLTLVYADAQQYVRSCNETFDVVFLDPPFHTVFLEAILDLLPDILADDAVVYLESERDLADVARNWTILKHSRAGIVKFGLIVVPESGES